MGMTIDEAMKAVKLYDGYYALTLAKSQELKKACNVLVDTTKKYQKIEQILKDIPYGGEATIRRIQEVVEDEIN